MPNHPQATRAREYCGDVRAKHAERGARENRKRNAVLRARVSVQAASESSTSTLPRKTVKRPASSSCRRRSCRSRACRWGCSRSWKSRGRRSCRCVQVRRSGEIGSEVFVVERAVADRFAGKRIGGVDHRDRVPGGRGGRASLTRETPANKNVRELTATEIRAAMLAATESACAIRPFLPVNRNASAGQQGRFLYIDKTRQVLYFLIAVNDYRPAGTGGAARLRLGIKDAD